MWFTGRKRNYLSSAEIHDNRACNKGPGFENASSSPKSLNYNPSKINGSPPAGTDACGSPVVRVPAADVVLSSHQFGRGKVLTY